MSDKQKYEDLIKRLKKAKEDNSVNDERYCCVIDKIVPELRESTDERIRKWLIGYFQINEVKKIIKTDDILAWLEKLKVFAEYGEGLYHFGNNGFTYVGNPTWDMSWLEKQGKVPPADKSESKFHEGDWVVFNNRHDSVYQVEKIENYEYTLRHFLGGSMPLSFSHEDMIRAWNVKDARDGDVLASQYNKPFIYNGNYDSILIGSYCGISAGDSFTVATEKCHWTENVSIYPATKEQRDLLFQKMHEDGYTFDFKKKELKKLKFRVGDEVITENEESLTITRIDEEGYWSNDLFICGFDDSAEWELVEQKHEWSEEDENMVRYIGNAITCKESAKYLEEKGVDMIKAHRWLEFLRSQKQWKPSQEQMYMLEWLTTNVLDDGVVGNKAKEVLYTLIEQLKSL